MQGPSLHAALAVLGLWLAACGSPAPPDVVLVTVDTLRADALGAYGARDGASPALDALAAQSAVFERALAASAATAPSHASLFTSRFVRSHSVGHRNGATRLGEGPTLAGAFQGAGYETAAFVSNMLLRRQLGFDRGFGLYDDALPHHEANRTVYERVAEETGAAALAWLAQPRAQPFFLWVHFNDPHGPYTPPGDALRAGAPARGETPLPVVPSQLGRGGIPAYQAQDGLRLPSEYRARYAGEVRYFDAWLGRLLVALEASGRESVVALTADHGEAMGELGIWFCHGHAVTPDLVHVPLLIRARGLPPGRVQGLAHHVDLAPTLLELAGLPPLPGAEGIALGPVARAGREIPKRMLFVETLGEVGVYLGSRFVRQATEPSLGETRKWQPSAWTWRDDGSFGPTQPAPQMAEALRQYASARAPFVFIEQALSDADRERLRALGYLEPESESASGAGDEEGGGG
jgi:arylsulfatase